MKHTGSCLCGGIEYEIDGPIWDVLNCHCADCRKSHGAAYRTRGKVKRENFLFVKGESLLQKYRHKPGERRTFCRECGSNIITIFDDESVPHGLALGTLDTPFETGPELHVFVSDKAPWHEITDDLPQHEELPADSPEIFGKPSDKSNFSP